MPTGSDYDVAIVIVNQHEPEGETAGRLLELADKAGYDPRVVEAQRGEHDAALSFRVPEDVAEAFNGERASLWPADRPIVNEPTPLNESAPQPMPVADEAPVADDDRPSSDNAHTSPSAKRGRASTRE